MCQHLLSNTTPDILHSFLLWCGPQVPDTSEVNNSPEVASWSNCSDGCGRGLRQRRVLCSGPADWAWRCRLRHCLSLTLKVVEEMVSSNFTFAHPAYARMSKLHKATATQNPQFSLSPQRHPTKHDGIGVGGRDDLCTTLPRPADAEARFTSFTSWLREATILGKSEGQVKIGSSVWSATVNPANIVDPLATALCRRFVMKQPGRGTERGSTSERAFRPYRMSRSCSCKHFCIPSPMHVLALWKTSAALSLLIRACTVSVLISACTGSKPYKPRTVGPC